jgi:hypothetical protein
MIKNGKLLSKRPVVQSDVQAMKEKRKLRVIIFSSVYIIPKVVGPFPGPCASGSYVHWAALFVVVAPFPTVFLSCCLTSLVNLSWI